MQTPCRSVYRLRQSSWDKSRIAVGGRETDLQVAHVECIYSLLQITTIRFGTLGDQKTQSSGLRMFDLTCWS